MFVDEVIISLEAGRGGDGCMAFRREKYVAMGGPFGGTGGKGGDIRFKVDLGLRTLIDLRYQKQIKARPGSNGLGKNKNGKGAEDTVVKVPIGTTIRDYETGVVIADLNKKNQEVIVAYGGRGGRGNVALATRSNPCPSYSENGEPGEVRKVIVELRMLADVGLVGLPSVGKSTILSMISNANPKIASYHFTTLSPNLGVVKTKGFDFTVADLPGLIEGASEGIGLGHKFLKHIERTKVIAHVIDMSGMEERDPYFDYLSIRDELGKYSKKLLEKPEIIIANKMDIESSKKNLELFKRRVKLPVIEISAINNKGLDKLVDKFKEMVKETPDSVLFADEEQESHVLYKFKKEKPFRIERDNNTFIIKGDEVEKIFLMTNFNTEEAMTRFSNRLRRMGIDEELLKMGINDGDIVRIMDYEFEWRK
ncbi:MAG: GTPase ObgE [Bacilli bacterium]|nr:GTPase ObgE [Bacilli bacterium]